MTFLSQVTKILFCAPGGNGRGPLNTGYGYILCTKVIFVQKHTKYHTRLSKTLENEMHARFWSSTIYIYKYTLKTIFTFMGGLKSVFLNFLENRLRYRLETLKHPIQVAYCGSFKVVGLLCNLFRSWDMAIIGCVYDQKWAWSLFTPPPIDSDIETFFGD